MTDDETTRSYTTSVRRSRSYLLRLSETELASWRAAAQRRECTVAALIRMAVTADILRDGDARSAAAPDRGT